MGIYEEKVKNGFRIGDRVIFTAEEDPDRGVFYGQTGTVCNLEDSYVMDSIGVEWDKERNKYHDLSGKCRNRHGWWVPYFQIERISVDLGEIEASEMDVGSLFQ